MVAPDRWCGGASGEEGGGPDTIRTCDLCLRRAALYPAELRVRNGRNVIDGAGGDKGGAPHERLSDREFEVMRGIASGESVGEIAARMHLSVKTVSTYRTRLLEKMGMATNSELTRYAIQNGLV